MGQSVDPVTQLNDCGCCEGLSVESPTIIENRPGLSAIAYRVGTFTQFKDTMLARLSGSNQPALKQLTTRYDDDFSIALLDSWATVADVLTFYQERIANESYLRTATERLSVLELARLIGYQLRPGVAASTYLAFVLDDAPGTLGQALSIGTTAQNSSDPLPPITIAIGTKVQSVPAPGEQAQTFETVEPISARPEWNQIAPRLTWPQPLAVSANFVIFSGTSTNLKKGDRLLIRDGTNTQLKIILEITPDSKSDTTRVDFVSPPSSLPAYVRPVGLPIGTLNDFLSKTDLNATTVKQIIAKSWSEEDLSAVAATQNWSTVALVDNISEQTDLRVYPAGAGVFAFRQRAAIFGHNAQDWNTLPIELRLQKTSDGHSGFLDGFYSGRKNTWADANFTSGTTTIFLDAVYQQIVVGSYIVLTNSTSTEIFTVTSVAEETKSDFNMSLKVTRLGISGSNINHFSPRTASVYLQSDLLALADLPIIDAISGNTVTLDRTYLGLVVGQRVILTGERADLEGVTGSESLTLQKVIVEAGFTVLTFDRSLAYSYVRNTVTINANVALATNGETVAEVMGSGDSTQAFQQFALRQPPLTYVSASTPSGAQSTLEVRVNDLLWHEVPSFFEHKPEERIYVTRQDDDDVTTVVFGDGVTGARVPTGQANIQAKYRKGIGLGGIVRADQLTQLMTRPLGVKGVTNPLPSAGAADSEQLADARTNAPLTVLTLDRVVSLQDYEDFARAFSGIGKSLATWTWFGEKRGIFVTVAGSDGAEVLDGSDLQTKLLGAMRQFGDPLVPLVVKSYQPRFFKITATIKVAPDFLPDIVLTSVEQKLRDTYSFNARAMGQPVHLSEVIGVMRNIAGVVAVDVQEFYRSDQSASKEVHIPAAFPQQGNTTTDPAELLILDPRPVKLGVMV